MLRCENFVTTVSGSFVASIAQSPKVLFLYQHIFTSSLYPLTMAINGRKPTSMPSRCCCCDATSDFSPWGSLSEDKGKNKQLGRQQPVFVRQAMKT